MPDTETALIRDLAARVAGLAASPANETIRRRWRDVNALRKPDRAPVWCRPVGAWGELLPSDALECRDPHRRGIEHYFRMVLIKHSIGDDSPVEPVYPVGAVWDVDPPNVWGVDTGHLDSGKAGGAWAYDPPLRTAEDFDRLRVPQFGVNVEATEERAERAAELLGAAMPVEVVCEPPLGATLGTAAADLRGLEQMAFDMAAGSELAHRLMAYLRDATLAAMDAAEASGRITRNNRGAMLESDSVGPEPVGGRLTCANLWCMANSQEFEHVSPAMWEEFLLCYQRPILSRFGLVAYGCCENLTHKIDGVLAIPNLRIFVASAWTDLGQAIERVGGRYVVMWRQKASDVVFPEDVGVIAKALDEGMRKLRGTRAQVVLRELQTLAGHPDRLHVWTRLAIEAAERWS